MSTPEETPAEQERAARRRSSAARIGAQSMWAKTDDWSSRTAPARQAFMAKFEREVDPEEKLPPEVRAKKADAAMRAYMGQMAKRRHRPAKEPKGNRAAKR